MGCSQRLWTPLKIVLCSADCDRVLVHCQVSADSTAAHHDIAGYWKRAGPLTQVVLRGCGHMVPHDAPLQAQAMLERWVSHVLNQNSDMNMGLHPDVSNPFR